MTTSINENLELTYVNSIVTDKSLLVQDEYIKFIRDIKIPELLLKPATLGKFGIVDDHGRNHSDTFSRLAESANSGISHAQHSSLLVRLTRLTSGYSIKNGYLHYMVEISSSSKYSSPPYNSTKVGI